MNYQILCWKFGSSAFYGCCSLATINFPYSLKYIGPDAFSHCNGLTSIEIPNTINTVYYGAFTTCSNLKTVTAPIGVGNHNDGYGIWPQAMETFIANGGSWTGNEETIRDFTDCTCLRSITLPSSVTSLGNYIFDGLTSLTEYTIPENIEYIGEGAFGYSGITNLTIPANVTRIGWMPFRYSQLSSLTILGENTILEDSPASLFWDCSYISNIEIPVRVASQIAWSSLDSWSEELLINITGSGSADNLSFENISYSNDIQVTYSEGITSIAEDAFLNCEYLTSMSIPTTVTSIGNRAFCDCYSLESITIPEGVTSIGYRTFYDCTNLTSVTILGNLTSIGEEAFSGCSSIASISIPNSVSNIGNNAFENCYSLESITMPENLTSIGDYAFYGCDALTSITIPENVTSMGYDAFYGLNSLESFTLLSSSIDPSDIDLDYSSLSEINYYGTEEDWAYCFGYSTFEDWASYYSFSGDFNN